MNDLEFYLSHLVKIECGHEYVFIRRKITLHLYSARSLLFAAAITLSACSRYQSNMSMQPISP